MLKFMTAALCGLIGLSLYGMAYTAVQLLPPSKPRQVKINISQNRGINVPATETPANITVPAQPPYSPRGWLIQTNGRPSIGHPEYSTFIPRLLEHRMIQLPSGQMQLTLQDLRQSDLSTPDIGMIGANSHGDNQFHSAFATEWIVITYNGPSYVIFPGGSGFGTGPANSTTPFTLSNSDYSMTVTPVP